MPQCHSLAIIMAYDNTFWSMKGYSILSSANASVFFLLLPIILLLLCQAESTISVANGYFDTLNHLSCHPGCEGVSPCPRPSAFFSALRWRFGMNGAHGETHSAAWLSETTDFQSCICTFTPCLFLSVTRKIPHWPEGMKTWILFTAVLKTL